MGVQNFCQRAMLSIALLGLPVLAQALTINLEVPNAGSGISPGPADDPALTLEEIAAARRAADYFESLFIDPITVTIRLGTFDGIYEPNDRSRDFENGNRANWLTKVKPCIQNKRFSHFTAALILDADDDTERSKARLINYVYEWIRLSGERGHKAILRYYYEYNNSGAELYTDSGVHLTCANAKALGLSLAQEIVYDDPFYGLILPGHVDGEIYLNRSYRGAFVTDRSSGVSPDQYDLENIFLHDIAHILGFFSMIDFRWYVNDVGDRRFEYSYYKAAPFDVWRFDAWKPAPHDLRNEPRNFALTQSVYDNNVILKPLSIGLLDADPRCSLPNGSCSASHWQDGTGTLMDPKIYPGEIRAFSEDERMVLDYLGYDKPAYAGSLPYFETESPAVIVTGAETQWEPSRAVSKAFEDNDSSESQDNIDPYFQQFNAAAQNKSYRGQIQMPGSKTMANINLSIRWAPPMEFVGPKVSLPEPNPNQDEFIEIPIETRTQHPLRILNIRMEGATDTGGFGFASSLSVRGVEFDPRLGEFGGFAITGFVDGWSNDVSEPEGQVQFYILLTQAGDFSEQSTLKFTDMHWRINEPSAFGINVK